MEQDKKIYTVKDFAELMQLSVRAARSIIRSQEIEIVRLGDPRVGKIRITKKAINDWLRSRATGGTPYANSPGA